MTGFLIPPWYVSERPNETEMYVCSIIWGLSISCAVFAASKAVRQTHKSWQRGKVLNTYIVLVWAEWIASVFISVFCWFFLAGYVPPSFWVFFVILCLWVVQMQCTVQIIINRVALIIPGQKRISKIKWGVFILISLINISVFCIWIPARLQISPRYIRINQVWDRFEKAIFAVIDAALNLYFIMTVRKALVKDGLVKYRKLYKFNAVMMCISVSLDIILIGSMSIGSGLVYIQFHPLVYLVKLHIELNMARLIAKIVRASNHANRGPSPRASGQGSGRNFSAGGAIFAMASSNSNNYNHNRNSNSINLPSPTSTTTTATPPLTRHLAYLASAADGTPSKQRETSRPLSFPASLGSETDIANRKNRDPTGTSDDNLDDTDDEKDETASDLGLQYLGAEWCSPSSPKSERSFRPGLTSHNFRSPTMGPRTRSDLAEMGVLRKDSSTHDEGKGDGWAESPDRSR